MDSSLRLSCDIDRRRQEKQEDEQRDHGKEHADEDVLRVPVTPGVDKHPDRCDEVDSPNDLCAPDERSQVLEDRDQEYDQHGGSRDQRCYPAFLPPVIDVEPDGVRDGLARIFERDALLFFRQALAVHEFHQ